MAVPASVTVIGVAGVTFLTAPALSGQKGPKKPMIAVADLCITWVYFLLTQTRPKRDSTEPARNP